MTTNTIALIGDVSVGKSSFLNSLGVGFISSVSLQKETSRPLWYRFSKEHNVDIKTFADVVDQMHTENERYKIDQELLDTSIVNNICDAEHTLPIRYDLDNFNVIDFPGLSDEIMGTLQSLMKQINLIIFVTDSNRAFMNVNEIEYFKSIQKIIFNEEIKGRYPEMIVLVNKYDDINDEDFEQVYERMESVIEFPKEKIFRLSSHKLLLHAASFYQIDLHIPKYMRRTEIGKIYRNACLSIPVIADDIVHCQENKLDNTIFIDHNKMNGDWDGLIEYLQIFPTFRKSKLGDKLGYQYYQWELKCLAVYDALCTCRSFNQIRDFKSDEKGLFWKLKKIYKRYHSNGLDMEIIYTKILLTIEMIFINYLPKKSIRFELLENMIADQMLPIKKYLHLMIKYANLISSHILKMFYLQYFIDSEIETDKEEYLQLSKIIFGREAMFNTESFVAISFVDQIKTSLKTIIKNKKSSPHYIVFYWLAIATIDKETLIYLNEEKMIKYDVLKRIDPALPIKFRYWMTTPGYDPLYHKLFHIDEIESVAKYYQIYANLEELNEMI